MRFLALLGILTVLGGAALDVRREAALRPGEDYLLVIEDPALTPAPEEPSAEERDEPLTLRLKTETGVQTVLLEEYLAGVVLSEMLPSFELEALKAQAVAARTFAARMQQNSKHTDADLCADPSCCQAYHSRMQLEKKLGAAFEESWEKATRAVSETEGEVLTYDGRLIEAVYYSCSGGFTEPAEAVWGSDVPYLQAVESPGEEGSEKYSTRITVPFSVFQRKLQDAAPAVRFAVLPEGWLGAVERSAGGGVAEMELGGVRFSGTKLRSLFALPSTLFDLRAEAAGMVFYVRGSGHRVGMSQYGADAMARQGADYGQILRHYYQGVTIKKLSRTQSGQFSAGT